LRVTLHERSPSNQRTPLPSGQSRDRVVGTVVQLAYNMLHAGNGA